MAKQRPGRGKAPRKSPWLLWIALIVVVLGFGGLIYAQNRRGETATAQARKLDQHRTEMLQKVQAGQLPTNGPGEQFANQGAEHWNDQKALGSFPYNSLPPTSGPHAEIFPEARINTHALPAYIQVHMLEHGNVLLQYNKSATPDDIALLKKIADEYNQPYSSLSAEEVTEPGAAVLVAPNDNMPGTIALTAWRRLQKLDHATGHEQEIRQFIDTWLTNYANGPH